jgi:hypothetical protein
MKKIVFALIMVLSVLPIFSTDSIDFSGYYKSFFLVFDPIDNPLENSNSLTGVISNHIRFDFSYKSSDKFSLNIAYDFIPKIENRTGLPITSDILNYTSSYRAYDLNKILLPSGYSKSSGGNFAVYQNLDRAFMKLSFNFADIYVGRQAISWGSGKLANPTDIFAPFSFNELDKEERRGIDAVRVRIPVGNLAEIDLGYVFGDRLKLSNSGFFLRSKFFMLDTDISFMIIGFKNNLLLGFDLTKPIGGAGFWFEGAYVKNNFYNKDKDEIPDNYTRISTGLDYNYKGVYMMIEYHYNGAGSKLPREYYDLFGKRAYKTNTIFLMGINYLSIMTSYQITGLLSNTNMIIYNITDKSMILSPKFEYNIAENIYLSLGAFISTGKIPYYSSCFVPPEIKSEFGMYPNMFFTSFRVYF